MAKTIILGLLTLLYPFAVYFVKHYLEPWKIASIQFALSTALWSSFELWSLYNGLIAYVLMGILLAEEYTVRIKTGNRSNKVIWPISRMWDRPHCSWGPLTQPNLENTHEILHHHPCLQS